MKTILRIALAKSRSRYYDSHREKINLKDYRRSRTVTTKIVANSHVQFDTCTVSYTCQTFRHVHFDTRITRVKAESHKLHNLTRVLEYTCPI